MDVATWQSIVSLVSLLIAAISAIAAVVAVRNTGKLQAKQWTRNELDQEGRVAPTACLSLPPHERTYGN